MADEEIEVAVDAATDAVIVDATSPSDDAMAELQRQYTELKSQDDARQREIESARQAEQSARQQAAIALQEVEQVRTHVADSDLQATLNAIAAVKAEADGAAAEHQSALAEGEYAKATEAQRKLSRAEALMVRYEARKEELEARRQEPRTEGRVEARAPADPFEARISGATPRTQAWLREHRAVVTDPELAAKAGWVHQAALKRGLAVDTDAYFRFAEQEMFPAASNTTTPENTTTHESRPRPMTAAPPSREASSATGGSSKISIKLSQGEVQSATDGTLQWNTGPNKGKPIGVQEMARRKAELMKNPKYAATYATQR